MMARQRISRVRSARMYLTALGISNRGVKYSTGLYVLRKTKAPALLVECCFVDNQNDYSHWNVEKCGDAIASAIAGKTVQGNASAPAKNPAPTPNAGFDFAGWVGSAAGRM